MKTKENNSFDFNNKAVNDPKIPEKEIFNFSSHTRTCNTDSIGQEQNIVCDENSQKIKRKKSLNAEEKIMSAEPGQCVCVADMTNNGDNVSTRGSIVVSQGKAAKTQTGEDTVRRREISGNGRTPCRASNIWINDTNIVTL